MDRLFDITGSEAPVGIPPNAVLFLKHGIRSMKLIHEEGRLLHVNWKGVKEGLTLSVHRLIHQAIKVHMVHDDKASCSASRQQIEVDWPLAKKNVDEFIWHDDHFAYVVAFTQDVCRKMHQKKAQARLGIM
jgi:hypothetical protein